MRALGQGARVPRRDVCAHQLPPAALSPGGRWDTPARGQVPRLIAINSPSMQLRFHLHAPVK